MSFLNTGQARIFGDDPGQRITETVTECVYDNAAEGVKKLKYAYMAVHRNKNDPSKGRKMKKAIRTSSARHYNHFIGTRLYKRISDRKNKPFEPFFAKLSNHSLRTNDSTTVIEHIKILATDEMSYIPPPIHQHPPKTKSRPKKWRTTRKRNQRRVRRRKRKTSNQNMDQSDDAIVTGKTLFLWFNKRLENWNASQRFRMMKKRMKFLDAMANHLLDHKANDNRLSLLARGTAYVKCNFRGSTCSAPTSAQILAMNRIGAIHIPTPEYLTTQTCAMCNGRLSVVMRGKKYLHDILYCQNEICKSQRWVHRDGNAALNMARKAAFDPKDMQQTNRRWINEVRKIKFLPEVKKLRDKKKKKSKKKKNSKQRDPPPQDQLLENQNKRELDGDDEEMVNLLISFANDQKSKKLRTE